VPLRFHSRFEYFGGFYGQGREGQPLLAAISPQGLQTALAELTTEATEVCCHPAAELDFSSSYGPERTRELETLCDPGVRGAVTAAGFVLASFAEHKRRYEPVQS
jgi:predicted glycoside hydrolase/deacetylase ChbG (UPF0249 family)